MRIWRSALGLALPILMLQLASGQTHRMSYSETNRTIDRIKDQSEKFKDHFDDDVHRSGVGSTTRQDMKHAVESFENAAKDLEHRYDKNNAAASGVQQLLADASVIDAFMSRNMVSPRVQNEWLLLRQDLDLLADSYDLDASWPSALARAETPAVVVVPVQPSDARLQDIVRDIQADTAAFESSVRGTLSSSASADLNTEGEINQYLGNFIVSSERLRTMQSSGYSGLETAGEVLERAELIDRYMKEHPLSISAQENWIRLRSDLVRLAAVYNLRPAWLSQ